MRPNKEKELYLHFPPNSLADKWQFATPLHLQAVLHMRGKCQPASAGHITFKGSAKLSNSSIALWCSRLLSHSFPPLGLKQEGR